VDDWTAVPRARRVSLTGDGSPARVLIDVAGWSGGVVRDSVGRWRADGAPPLGRFGIGVSPERRAITWLSRVG